MFNYCAQTLAEKKIKPNPSLPCKFQLPKKKIQLELLGGFQEEVGGKKRPKKADFGVPEKLWSSSQNFPAELGEIRAAREGGKKKRFFVSPGRFLGFPGSLGVQVLNSNPSKALWEFVSAGFDSLGDPASLRDFPFQGIPGILFPLESPAGLVVTLKPQES